MIAGMDHCMAANEEGMILSTHLAPTDR